MTTTETIGLYEDQWDLDRLEQPLTQLYITMMTFECGQYTKATIEVFLSDQTACFDRMWPALMNIVAQAFGMEPEAFKYCTATIDITTRHINIRLWISTGSYGNSVGTPKIQGKIQERGAVSSLWYMTSILSLIPMRQCTLACTSQE